MILFQPALRESFGKTKFFIRYVSAKTEESKKKVIENLRSNENLYPYVYNNLDILRNPDSVPGDIYVVGVPLFYYLSGREQAVPINGWVVDLLLPEMWDQLDKQLNKNKPVYIFLDADYKKVVTDLSFQTIKFIKENYSVVSKSKNGSIWFLRNDKLEKSVVSN